LLEPPNQARFDKPQATYQQMMGIKEKARSAQRAKLMAIRIAALWITSNSNFFDSLLFYLTPLLCLLPDYLTPTFPLSNTMPDSCPGTVGASYSMKLNQQKLINLT
jgi:hypothetical protein